MTATQPDASYPGQGTLRRVEMRFEREFTQVRNRWARDKRLSRAARGLFTELMTHNVGQEVSIQALTAQGPEGRDAIRRMVTELEAYGYLTRHKARRRGQFGGTVWTLRDPFEAVDNRPAPVLPGLENPRSTVDGFSDDGKTDDGKTDVGSTASVNPTTIENYLQNNSPTEFPALPQEQIGSPVDNSAPGRVGPVWADPICPAAWKGDRGHILGPKSGKCTECAVAPVRWAAAS